MLCRPKILGYLAGILLIVVSVFMCVCTAHTATSRGVNVTAKTPSGSSRDIPLYSGYHALVIGCSNYQQGWPSLPNAAKDAKSVGQMLKDMGWDVNLVIDPDTSEMHDSFAKLITGPGKKHDRGILIWYSGHGYTLKEADGSKLGYIVPVNSPDPEKDEYGFMRSAISMRDIETVAKRIFSKHVLVIFDSCFSGAIFRMVRAKPSHYIKEKVAEPVRQFITAGNEDEQVPDKSVFKDVFVKGIKDGYGDRNEDGFITGEELGAYLAEEVVNYSRGAQHPQFGKINNPALDRGDFVFVKLEVSELDKLTQEISRLRKELAELSKLREENTRLRKDLAEQKKLVATLRSRSEVKTKPVMEKGKSIEQIEKASKKDDWISNIAGGYSHSTLDGDWVLEFQPKDGVLKGRFYSRLYSRYSGELFDFKKIGNRTLHFKFNTVGHKGYYEITFSTNYSSFEGEFFFLKGGIVLHKQLLYKE